jgi:hypothetical protein
MLSACRLHEVGVVPASSRYINDPKYWRDRAEEARGMAEGFGDPAAIETMVNVARRYEQLAEQAEARLKSWRGG